MAPSVLSLMALVSCVTGLLGPRQHMLHHRLNLNEQPVVARDAPLYEAHVMPIPVDHFHNDSLYAPHSSANFSQRYWVDDRFYRPGGPVFLLAGGETSGADRLPFLQKGIIAQLAEATHGLGIVLEHRYYGESLPTDDFSTASLRFLTTDQALADFAYFAQTFRIPGREHVDVSPATTPWIGYGGSYAGAFVAFARQTYPEVFWGAISSSGVTAAVVDFWEYYEAARVFAPGKCATQTARITDIVDTVLASSDKLARKELRAVWGLQGVSADADFAAALSLGIQGLQGTNWDPAVSSTAWSTYCGNVSAATVQFPTTQGRERKVRELVVAGGYADRVEEMTTAMLNSIGWTQEWVVKRCVGRTQDECFGSGNETFYAQDDLTQTWRLWMYQVCTEWGYFQTGSSVPSTQLPLISRLIDLPHESLICRHSFNITHPPAVSRINARGGFSFSYPRVALLDGEHDPWRAATPHKLGLPQRETTASEPYWLIPGGVHHWDENGVFANESVPGVFPPKEIVEVQAAEVTFVKGWLKEWEREKSVAPGQTVMEL
ncbi:hypothetical protein TD95_000807 [Thielaviopsis punctulata]|uniref:Serine carboxypeptidase S28 n=1 Tax=Thielaviopsis punctulata TaxID=72032 RepID=A0A0F4ZN18_9PEZI|nr:hypothetical protein TD95_000807 [Thielaviopsis punctulata]